LSFQILHDHKRLGIIRDTKVENENQIGMIEFTRGFSFFLKSNNVVLTESPGDQHFDCHHFVEVNVSAFVNHTHSAAAKQGEVLEPGRDQCAGFWALDRDYIGVLTIAFEAAVATALGAPSLRGVESFAAGSRCSHYRQTLICIIAMYTDLVVSTLSDGIRLSA